MDYRPFLLKIGYSILQNKLLPYSPIDKSKLVFDGLKFEVCGSNRFRDDWSMILREQGN